MKYFEIEFDNAPRNQDGNESDCVGEYSTCIIGEREPSIEEATKFCREDMIMTGYKYVVNVLEISRSEALTFFDMDRENDFPIFKSTTPTYG